jgi:hypothetical protein
LGPYDFNASTNEDGETLLGAVMLRSAALALRPQNVTWLLSHGVRTQNAVTLEWWQYKRDVDDFQKMDQILKAYQNPGIEVLCCPVCHDPRTLSGHRPAGSHTRCLHISSPKLCLEPNAGPRGGTDAAVNISDSWKPIIRPSNFKLPKAREVYDEGLVSLVIQSSRQSRDRSPSQISKAVFRASAAGATPEGDAFFTTTQPKNTEVTNFPLADRNTDFRDKVNVR